MPLSAFAPVYSLRTTPREQAFGAMGMRRVEAEVDAGNDASNALLRRPGFVHEGVLRERRVAKGRAYGVHVYGLLASEWSKGLA